MKKKKDIKISLFKHKLRAPKLKIPMMLIPPSVIDKITIDEQSVKWEQPKSNGALIGCAIVHIPKKLIGKTRTIKVYTYRS